MGENESIVSTEAIQISDGAHAGKWHGRFSICRADRILYRGSADEPSPTKEKTDRTAAKETCRVLLDKERLLY